MRLSLLVVVAIVVAVVVVAVGHEIQKSLHHIIRAHVYGWKLYQEHLFETLRLPTR